MFFIIPIITFALVDIETTPVATPSESPAIDPEIKGASTSPGCPGIAVGAGNSDYAPEFLRAYQRHGGADRLGCAQNRVTSVDGGVHQNLQKGRAPSAIFATEPGHAIVLEGVFQMGFRSIGDDNGMKSIELACYPRDEGIRLAEGFKLEVGAGGCQPSVVIKKGDGQWFWVQPAIWELYDQEYGGPEGVLGYPTNKAVPIAGTADLKQNFEHGALCIENGTANRC